MGVVKNIPELRFPIDCENWVVKKMRDITTYVDYRGKTPEKVENGIFLITAKNIKQGFIDYEVSKEYILETHYEEVMRRGKPQIGDVLITTEAPLGNVAQIDNENVALAQRVIKLRGKESILRNSFLLHRLISPQFQTLLYQRASGTTAKGIKGSELHKLEISIPKPNVQTKIANFITTVDERINLLTQQKEKLEQYKKGVMQKIFSQQLRFKDDNGNVFPEWEEKRLGEIGEIVSGLTYSPKEINEKGTLVLRSSNVQNRSIVLEDNVYVLSQNYNPVQENDILICVRNGSQRLIGKNALIKKSQEGMAFGAFMSVYRSPFNQFIFHFFDTDKYYKSVYRNLGATINSINGSDLKQFKIPFPSLPEQQKIASFLSSIDKKIELINQQIEQSKTWKKGLLQKMFV